MFHNPQKFYSPSHRNITAVLKLQATRNQAVGYETNQDAGAQKCGGEISSDEM